MCGCLLVTPRHSICLWYNLDALEAVQFYAATFADSAVQSVLYAPGDYPAGRQGDVLMVCFTVLGIQCVGLDGGPEFTHSEAFSFQVCTDDQAETDWLWQAITSHGWQTSECGWCKDKWGVSWQITPRVLLEVLSPPDAAAAGRASTAMMGITRWTLPPWKPRCAAPEWHCLLPCVRRAVAGRGGAGDRR